MLAAAEEVNAAPVQQPAPDGTRQLILGTWGHPAGPDLLGWLLFFSRGVEKPYSFGHGALNHRN